MFIYCLKKNQRSWPLVSSKFTLEGYLGAKFEIVSLQANRKTRNRAYDILVEIAHAFGDEEKGGNRESLFKFFKEVNIQICAFYIFF